jgi:hypothetical protein
VIDGSADHRKAHGDVHAGLQSQDLDRAVPLVVVHGHHHVVVAATGQEEQGVGGQRTAHVPAPGAAGFDGGRDFLSLLTPAE